jgi:speckle-type POZ protein
MRSPVFRAELYGAAGEKNTSLITVADMQPVVFEALLHFIYNDSLPIMFRILGRDDYNRTIRHLLVAAHRYAMERLKIMCERILCENIDVNSVVATLALADQLGCGRLTDACVQFIASLDRLQIHDVVATKGYAELKAICPVDLAQLWDKTCRLGRSKSLLHVNW